MYRSKKDDRGVLTVEATISFTIFMMVILTILFIMRIVYAYALIQHAVSQTAKELSMYTYLYQVSGLGGMVGELQNGAKEGEEQFNADAESIVKIYEELAGNWDGETLENVKEEAGNLTTDPMKILGNVKDAIVGNASRDLVNSSFSEISRAMMAGYIAADSDGAGADQKLKDLQVIGGLGGLNFSASSFFEDGQTIDIAVCYTLDPILPIDLMPEMNLMNRASIRGMSGASMFQAISQTKQSVWDEPSVKRGKKIQQEEGVRNLPDNFKTFSAYNEKTGEAIAELSIDLRSDSYQKESGISSVLRAKCRKIDEFDQYTLNGYTLNSDQIRSKRLIIYIPSSTDTRNVDRTLFDRVLKEIQNEYPNVKIEVEELD